MAKTKTIFEDQRYIFIPMEKELKPQDTEGMSISEEMFSAELSLRNAFTLIEAILVETEEYPPKTEEGKDDMAMLQDFYDVALKAFDRAESTFWEIEGH